MPADLSIMAMYQQADLLVKAVMLGLLLASLSTWTVLLARSVQLHRQLWRQGNDVLRLSLPRGLREAMGDQDAPRQGAAARMLEAARAELRASDDALHDGEGVKERLAWQLQRIEADEGRQLVLGTGLLATVGAVAPFVGLFGTVWGIMNAFIGIARSQASSLAVVAPGIAEALLATALGLVAAIPAVVAYNHLARRANRGRAQLADMTAAVMRLVSRDLSRGVSGAPREAP
ncbi:tonB-system energizer ExbB [Stenotrophomonas sp. ESTM1D_MKCIP4_1]|uniref:tonB-system energizer ExbB n=1 Tax=Stenotrophomonas sp. ESTM1D_MKCIP4_1 TaxID=2072414 RepID=UPI000D542072|nr:tonB-system energizer ExbB [Stenotrophomonas sp. ESTM1D_MKCIP4_1]AWH54933.1 tonB-system energizer ExbB [Stenotrophomonas sp. ESTM1D_MKCIP4_1]